MKKVLVVILSIILIISFMGCSRDDTEEVPHTDKDRVSIGDIVANGIIKEFDMIDNKKIYENSFDVISVKDYGAVGDGVVDDTLSIENAIEANEGGTLFIPKGTYKITRRIGLSLVNGIHLYGEYGTILKMERSSTTNESHLMNFADVQGTVSLRNIVFDGNKKVVSCIIITNTAPDGKTAMENVKSEVYIENCSFLNGVSNTADTQTSSMGISIDGGFNKVHITRCIIKDFDSTTQTEHGASRGINIVNSFGKDNWTKTSIIENCHIEDIYKMNETMNADGIFIQTLYNVPYALDDSQKGHAIITKNVFKNCRGRGIKSQVGTILVSENKFIRNKWNGQFEVDLQRHQGIVINNTFNSYGFYATCIASGIYDISYPLQVLISGNILNKLNHTGGTFVFIGASPLDGNLMGVTVQDNFTKGNLNSFIEVRMSGNQQENHLKVINNTVETLESAFIETYLNGSPSQGGGTLTGIWKNNLYMGSAPVPRWNSVQPSKFAPVKWEDNIGLQ